LFLQYIKDKDPELINTLFALTMQNEFAFHSYEAPFNQSSGTYTFIDGSTYDMTDDDQRRALANVAIQNYYSKMKETVDAIVPGLPIGEGTFSMGAVGKTYDNSKGIRTIEGNKDRRFPMTAVELLKTDIDFLDFHVYRWGAKGTGKDVFMHFAENMKLTTNEGQKLMKSKPIIMGEFGSFKEDEETLDEAIVFVKELEEAALEFGFKGSGYWTMRCFEQTRLWNLMWENGKMLKAFSGVTPAVRASEKPNVVIFLMDDLDFSGMGAGYDLMEFPSTERLTGDAPEFPVVVTPNIDKLVSDGLIFNRFYITSPVCTPCRYSLLTGKYASTAHNLSSDFASGQTVHNITWNTHVKPGQYNLSKMLKSVGYRTGIAGKMHCEDGYAKMRAIYQKYTKENPLSPEAMAEITAGHWEFVREVKELYQWDYVERVYSENADASFFPPQLRGFNLDWCTQGALEFIEENQTKPFFLYFPVNFPHGNSGGGKQRFHRDRRVGTPAGILDEIPGVLPDIKEAQKQILAAGGNPEQTASLTMVDYALGAIDQKLRETGNYDNTIFIYLSDHQKVAKNTPHEGARVPCVIRWPEKIKQQGRTDALCANIDLLPTLAQIVGAQIPENTAISGESFAPLLLGKKDFNGCDLVLLEINYARALIQGDYKYIEYFAPDKVRKAVVSGQTEFHQQIQKTCRVGWFPSSII